MTLRELISYLMEKGQVLSVSSQRQWDDVGVLFVNIYELQFLDISLFQYFMFFMIILTGVTSIFEEAKLHHILPAGWDVIYLIINFLVTIWYFYFAWLILKFGLGWMFYYFS